MSTKDDFKAELIAMAAKANEKHAEEDEEEEHHHHHHHDHENGVCSCGHHHHDDDDDDFKLQGQTLHAKTLGFIHPTTGEYLEIDAPLPEYFEHLLTVLEK